MSSREQTEKWVDEAASFLAPLGPIYQFVASNPRAGLIHMPEDQAMRVFRRLVAPQGLATCEFQCPTLTDILDERTKRFKILPRLNRKVIRYVGAYCDMTQAQWSMEREGGLLNTWRDLVQSDLSLARKWKTYMSELLSRDAFEALASLLEALGVPDDHAARYLRRHLFQMPGWSSHIVWRQAQGKEKAVTKYLVMRLFYELVLTEPLVKRLCGPSEKPWAKLSASVGKGPAAKEEAIPDVLSEQFQRAAEVAFRDKLVRQLAHGSTGSRRRSRPSCQLVCCIDAREGRLREAWEAKGEGRYESFGVAGFFGVPAKFTETGSHMELALCPLPVTPVRCVREVSDNSAYSSRQALRAFAIMMQKKLKGSLSAAFGFVDIVGPAYAFVLLARAFFPGLVQQMFRSKKGVDGSSYTHLDTSEFPLAEKVSLAEGMLRSIGLTENFAPVVLLCGHESSSANNPYHSALQCGACGGNTGRYSARILADILNEKEVRAGLKCQGIEIPEDTHFVGSVHNTTTDAVTLFDGNLPASVSGTIARLKADLASAGEQVRKKRMPLMPHGLIDQLNQPGARACDPANVVPEMGLYAADAIIVGERQLTEGLDLEGRAFLHSYDWQADENGDQLAGIFGGAVYVASGIKEQYRTSALDNRLFGSGNKVTLNPFGGIGVMQGAWGDLKWGLTEQSVLVQNGLPRDVPMRLLVVVKAPPERVSKVVSQNETVANLVKNDWIRLVVIDPNTQRFSEASGLNNWKQLQVAA